jgi:transposase
MEHVGIDLGAAHSHLVVMTDSGELKARLKLRTSEVAEWLKLCSPSRVVMEACTQSPAMARLAMEAKHEACVVPGNVVRALGVGARGIKTDDRDAEMLARASVRNQELPSVHLRSEQSCSRREVISSRALLVESRKSIVLSVKSWLRGQLIHLKGRAVPSSFGATVRNAALARPEGLPKAIEVLLQTYDYLTEQIGELDEQIQDLVDNDSTCKRLRSIPGVGPHTSLAFTTHIDDPKRFASSEHLASYLALVPGEATTGGKTKRTGTIKAGPKHLKGLLVQSAWAMWRTRRADPIVLWARAIADKRGKRVAVIALARKIATIMWSCWKNETSYDPTKAARARALPEEPSILPTS